MEVWLLLNQWSLLLLDHSMRHPLFQDPRSLALPIQDQEQVPHHPSGAQPPLPDQHQRMAGRGRLRQGKAVIQTNSATQHQDKRSSLPRDRLPYIYMVLWCHGEGHKYARHSTSGMKNSAAKTFSHEALHERFTLCKLRRPTRKITFSYAYLCLSCPVLEIETTEKWPVSKYLYHFSYFF